MRRVAILLLVAVACESARASLVIDQNILLTQGPLWVGPFDYALTVYQDAEATDPTSIFFDATPSTLIFRGANLDQGSEWYFAAADDVFSKKSIEADSFVLFNQSNVEFSIPSGLFYLGVNTDLDDDFNMVRDVFGWVLIENSPSGLTLVSSAVGYQVPGILIGQYVVIPEPSSFAFSFLGCLALLAARRKR